MTDNKLTEAQWREKLTPEQFNICRCSATEPPFTGKYADCKDDGIYHCSCCGQAFAVSPGRDDSLQKAQGCCQSEVRDSARGRLKFYPE